MSSASMRDEMPHGRARTKVAGDDEMLRTGFHNGTPLESGKIADSDPVDLFAPARGVAQAADEQQQQQMRRTPDQQQQQQKQEGEQQQQVAGGGGVAAATENYSAPEHKEQRMAGGRLLGRQ